MQESGLEGFSLAECPICAEPFDGNTHRALLLPCTVGHVLCKKCVEKLFLQNERAEAASQPCHQSGAVNCAVGRHSACPFCRSRFHLPHRRNSGDLRPTTSQLACAPRNDLNRVLRLPHLEADLAAVVAKRRRDKAQCVLCKHAFDLQRHLARLVLLQHLSLLLHLYYFAGVFHALKVISSVSSV